MQLCGFGRVNRQAISLIRRAYGKKLAGAKSSSLLMCSLECPSAGVCHYTFPFTNTSSLTSFKEVVQELSFPLQNVSDALRSYVAMAENIYLNLQNY